MVTDLFLIDINMLDMNGFELYTEILKVDVNVKICFYVVRGSKLIMKI